MARHCTCTPERNPCGFCASRINRAEIERIDPSDEEDHLRMMERQYDAWQGRIAP